MKNWNWEKAKELAAERNAKIVAAVRAGQKPASVARKFAISRQRVLQIVHAAK